MHSARTCCGQCRRPSRRCVGCSRLAMTKPRVKSWLSASLSWRDAASATPNGCATECCAKQARHLPCRCHASRRCKATPAHSSNTGFQGVPILRWSSRLRRTHMLQNLAAEIINCYERARLAREEAERASNDDFKADFLAAEGRWLALAHSYELQHRLSRTVAEFDRRRKAGAITRMLREQGAAFGPVDVTRLTIAYHAVLHRLGLVDHEN